MSRRVVRIAKTSTVERFQYAETTESGAVVASSTQARSAQVVSSRAIHHAVSPAATGTPHQNRVEAKPVTAPESTSTNERDAFAEGYRQGERAGVEVAARQLQVVHQQLGQTLAQLVTLRESLTHRTEQQVVELALAVAARIVHRELSLDRELLLVMARIALDRLSDVAQATIRLHPDDEAAARGTRDSWPAGAVRIVADPSIRPGGCVVQTDCGIVDVGVDAQIKELSTALLGEARAAQVAT